MRLLTTLRRAAFALAALLLVGLAAACLVYPPVYVWRVLVWMDSDVDDQYRFASRPVHAAPGAGELPVAPDVGRVQQAYAQARPGQTLEAWLEAQGTLGFVVLQHGRVVYEGYFNGHRRELPATSFSVAKSVLGMLLDAAIEDGLVGSLDDPVTAYLPELRARDARFEHITLRHLVDMASGLRYRELHFLHGDDAKTYYHPDLRRLALDESRIEQAPGQAWQYNNYHPLLVGLVLERRTGMAVARWLEQRLWQPAGMAADASWSLDRADGGIEKLESGINARTLDYARFGQLMLDDGVARDGRRVLTAASVRAATSPAGAWALDHRRPGQYYKHYWWGWRRADGGYDFYAHGNHGQFVYVAREQGIVIARNGRRYGVAPDEWPALFAQLAERLGAADPTTAR